jgi:methionyl-tRNA formyltransferase
LNPWPGVAVLFQGRPLKLLRAEPVNTAAESAPGVLVDPLNGLVTCGHASALRLLEVQPPGKRPMPWPDFARGQRPHTGDTLIGRES